jgi:hypothetical protein
MEFTDKAIKILFCMIREFYVEVDCLVIRYDCLMNCIKCLNNPSLSTAQGIGKALSDYGAALTVLVSTRDNLLKLVMKALALSEQLHWEICDNCGFSKIIEDLEGTLHCEIPCSSIPIDSDEEEEEKAITEMECLFPTLSFPICNTPYYRLIDRLYKKDKKKMHELTERKKKLTKTQLALQAAQQSLTNALKETAQTARCS